MQKQDFKQMARTYYCHDNAVAITTNYYFGYFNNEER